MAVQLNHTIVSARDKKVSARFLASILGLPSPTRFGPFMMVQTTNGVSVDFADTYAKISPQHVAFLISEAEFDEVLSRIRGLEVPHWAGPGRVRQGRINHRDGGRGVYFEDPNGHLFEVLTRPYGSAQ